MLSVNCCFLEILREEGIFLCKQEMRAAGRNMEKVQ